MGLIQVSNEEAHVERTATGQARCGPTNWRPINKTQPSPPTYGSWHRHTPLSRPRSRSHADTPASSSSRRHGRLLLHDLARVASTPAPATLKGGWALYAEILCSTTLWSWCGASWGRSLTRQPNRTTPVAAAVVAPAPPRRGQRGRCRLLRCSWELRCSF